MTSPRALAHVARLYLVSLFFLLTAFAVPKSALAEKVIAKGDDWQVYTDGRVGAFASWVYGQGFPQTLLDANGNQIRDVKGGGFGAIPEQSASVNGQPDQGTINSMRIRSGFIGNTFGLGVRGQVTPWTTVMGYIQFWAYVESEGRQKNVRNYADVRQGYAKLEGWWGSLLAGRTRALFSRGATDIDSLYAHRWGVGWPGGIDSNGPTLGQIGFGVMGSGFAAGIIYGTPVLKGFQLNVGAFDPIVIPNGGWTRTKYVRPETELTFERKFGETGKVVLFGNGVYQKVYKAGYCVPPTAALPVPCEDAAFGVGYGGRFELGPVHLGAAGHYGKGLGLNYALESSDASNDVESNLRYNDGYYVQTQFVIRKFDLFAGWGIDRVMLTDYDKQPPAAGDMVHSIIKYQMGINAGIVYNVTPNVHLDLDYFRAAAKWFYGESQVVNVTNAGMTFNW